jgi:LuxR family transcriptional regulator, maltose regulon positive regulatory protein
MHPSILPTTIRIPPLSPRMIPRERLVRALEEGVRECRIVLIAAPAGYGKSTVLAEWAHRTDLPVAWLTIDSEDTDAEGLLRGLVAAWSEAESGFRESRPGLLAGARSPDLELLRDLIVEAATGRAEPLVFVLDEIHLLTDPHALDTLRVLLERYPPTCRFVLAGRGAPNLPLARHRARGDLADLSTADLRLRDDEVHAVMAARLGTTLPAERIAAMQERLEGWFAGVQLVCHALAHQSDALPGVPISGRHRFVAAYLREEVLTSLPEAQRQFLLSTSILDRLCAGVCDAVTDQPGSQEMLEQLERAGLFLDALDEELEWFRYHPLFREVLQEEAKRLFPDDIETLQQRAGRWHLDHEMPDEALAHAIAAGDIDLATRIIEDYAVIRMESGEIAAVRHWVETIPARWYETRPALNLARVVYLLSSGAFEQSAALLDEIDALVKDAQDRQTVIQRGKIATARCAIACYMNDIPAAERYGEAALRDLSPDDRFFISSIHHALGDTYSRNAMWDRASESLNKALRVVHRPSHRIRSVHIYGALADLELRRGHLQQAGHYWEQAIEGMRDPSLWGRLPLPVTGWVSIRMGELHYEWNRLDEARSHLRRGRELAELGGDTRAMIAGCLLGARLDLAAQAPAGAAETLEAARGLIDHAQFPEWSRRFDRLRVECWIAQRRWPALRSWVGGMPADGVRDARAEPEIDQITLARALLAMPDAPDRDRAMRLLDRVLAQAEAEDRAGLLAEGLALRAIGHWHMGKQQAAGADLARSLEIAEPEGFVRTYLDLGEPIGAILRDLAARPNPPDYARTLLRIMTNERVSPGPDPLTEREQEVLGLLAAGMTNAQIGDALFISPETVKKHSSSIYAKLGVSRRIEAVRLAQERGMLGG